MRFLLDTDVCIYLLTDAFPRLTARIGDCDEGSVGVSSITFAELSHGSANGKMPPPPVLDAFLGAIILCPFDEAAARAYATLPLRRGRFDRLIAAHAISRDLILVTNNTRDFADIPGVRVENWT
jgi:tRNA(fMet)-specific endonuclease VapC